MPDTSPKSELHQAALDWAAADATAAELRAAADGSEPMISELHQAALDWGKAGFAIFPIAPDAKKPPTIEEWQHEATTDSTQINQWWSACPDCNIGFHPEPSGMWVLDVDGPLGRASLSALESLHGTLPSTYTVQTPRGPDGLHLYFRGHAPTTVGTSTRGLADHLDTRGENGYVLLPPSRVGGKEYVTVNATGVAHAPEWVADAIRTRNIPAQRGADTELDLPANIERAVSALKDAVARKAIAVSGQGGDNATFRQACEVLDLGVSPETAVKLLAEHWNPYCEPPWEIEDLEYKVANAASYKQNEGGAYAVSSPQSAFATFLSTVTQHDDSSLRKTKRSRFYPEAEEDWQNTPEPSWLIPELIPARSTILLIGQTQSYKSFLALDIALAIATGRETFQNPLIIGQTIYAAGEGRATIKRKRTPAWKIAHSYFEPLGLSHFVMPEPLIAMPGEREEFIHEIEQRQIKPQLIVLDTVTKAMAGLNENDARDAGMFIHFCDSLVERFGCSVLAIHHLGKDADRGARGSSAFHAGFDSVLEARANRDTKTVELRVLKHKDAEEREEPWTFEGKTVGPSLVFFPTDASSRPLRAQPPGFISRHTVGKALEEVGATSPETAIATFVLAGHFIPADENESVVEHQKRVRNLARGLDQYVSLEGYRSPAGWYLPVTKEEGWAS
jgi:hypothetical protein